MYVWVCYSHLVARDLAEAQEEVKEEGIGYVVMKNLFSKEEDFKMKVETKTRKTTIRESADLLTLGKKVSGDYCFDLGLKAFARKHLWVARDTTPHCRR